jgi:hypothetical protein
MHTQNRDTGVDGGLQIPLPPSYKQPYPQSLSFIYIYIKYKVKPYNLRKPMYLFRNSLEFPITSWLVNNILFQTYVMFVILIQNLHESKGIFLNIEM